jgi:hypothetical protein
MDGYNKELCDERHENVTLMITKMDKLMDTLFSRMNWFMLTAIAALITALVDVLLKKGGN